MWCVVGRFAACVSYLPECVVLCGWGLLGTDPREGCLYRSSEERVWDGEAEGCGEVQPDQSQEATEL